MPIEDSIFCIPVDAEKTNKSPEGLTQRFKNGVAKILVVGGGATVAITIPTVMVLATLNKQPELAAMLAKTGGFAGLLTLGGFLMKKTGAQKPSHPEREESDDELRDC